MSLSRRQLLQRAGALGAASLLPGVGACDGADGASLPSYAFDGEPGPETLFQHGVASGDPLPDGVVLWTRVSPDQAAEVDVFWEVALDEAFTERVGAGWLSTDASRDYTVKLDAAGLLPATPYH